MTTAALTTFSVDTPADGLDSSPGDGVCRDANGDCTLRAALMEARYAVDDVEILLGEETYILDVPPDAGETYMDLGGDLDVLLPFESPGVITIRGASRYATRIVSSGADRVFHVHACTAMTLVDLSIEGGAPARESRELDADHGGGLFNQSSCAVTLDHVLVAENTARVGGGLANHAEGTLRLHYTEVRLNRAERGAGIASFGRLDLSTSTVAENQSTEGAAGIWSAAGSATIHRSTLSGNVADYFGEDPVGALLVESAASLQNVTISSNSGGPIGGVLNRGRATLNHVTFYDNGITLKNDDGRGARTTITNSIMEERVDLACVGTITSGGHNIDLRDECGFHASGDQVYTEANIGDLGADMGPTWVHPITPDSPARNRGIRMRGLAVDQRGVPRSDEAPDIGAYEVLDPRFCVDTLEDAPDRDPGDGRCWTDEKRCSLRAAIMETNALRGPDVVTLCVEGTFELTRLGALENGADTGDLDIVDDLTIHGLGTEVTVIDGLREDRIFDVGAGFTQAGVMITDLSIVRGQTLAGLGGGVLVDSHGSLRLWNVRVEGSRASGLLLPGASGGGIANLGTLDLQEVVVSRNEVTSALGTGGGVGSDGLLRMRWAQVIGNTAVLGGGVAAIGLSEIDRSNILENRAEDAGGGILNRHHLRVRDTTVGFNQAYRRGGGVYAEHPGTELLVLTTSIDTSTLRDNSVEPRGPVLPTGSALHLSAGRGDVVNSTVSGNHGSAAIYFARGGRLVNVSVINNASHLAGTGIELVNTILHGTSASWLPPCSDPVISLGHNIEGGVSCALSHPTDQAGIVSMLGLEDNGGPTWTHELTWDAIAVDAGDPFYCPDLDQRGAPRWGECDVGAYEYGTVP